MTAIKKYREKILTKAKKYYKNNKDRLREQKTIGIDYLKKYIYIYKRANGRNSYRKMSEEREQK